MSKEEWKDVVGYGGYYKVSDLGNIRSVGRYRKSGNQYRSFSFWTKGSRIQPSFDKDGYLIITLGMDGKRITKKVHRLVAEAFIGNELGYPAVNHIDSVRSNNTKSNLEWCTNQMNSTHAMNAGRLSKGECHQKVNNSLISFKLLEYWIDKGYSSKELQEVFKVSRSVVSAVKHRKHWSSKEETTCLA